MIRILLYLVFIAGISISTATTENESIYEILKSNGLPIGIFPKGVREFNFNSKTGRFYVHLNHSCDAKYETELHYDVNITGKIETGQIVDLIGISVQELFLWLKVKAIQVDDPSSGLIYFDVGVIRKQYSLSVFETPRDCAAVSEGNKVLSSMLSLYKVDETLGRDIL